VYLKSMLTMPDSGWSVREVNVLNVDTTRRTPPGRPVRCPRAHGFKLVRSGGSGVYTLFRFRSPRPVHPTPDELIGDKPLANREEADTLVGLQLPREP
jgi:hypothetical protein